MGTGSLPGVKRVRGVTLTPNPLQVLWSRKSRAIPVLPVWVVRPVQSLSACTKVRFTYLTVLYKAMIKKGEMKKERKKKEKEEETVIYVKNKTGI
jgi:hypothetical protein